jgi:hypothetical protein
VGERVKEVARETARGDGEGKVARRRRWERRQGHGNATAARARGGEGGKATVARARERSGEWAVPFSAGTRWQQEGVLMASDNDKGGRRKERDQRSLSNWHVTSAFAEACVSVIDPPLPNRRRVLCRP